MKRIYILRIIAFILILVIPVITMNLKNNRISEIDNKKLIEISDVLSGDFTTNAEEFINNRIGFRTTMINAYTKAMDSLFNYMIHPSYQYGQDGYVFSKLSREGFDSEYQDTFSNFILKIQDYCNSRDINFLYAVEPSKTTVYSEYLPIGVNYQNFNLNYLLDSLTKNNINYVYTGDNLINAKNNYQVFDKKYDANHWNETGAIIGISTILNKLNEIDSSIDKFDINNYDIGVSTHTTLPVSYFPINEETITYELKDSSNIKNVDTFIDKIKISEHYSNFAHYINTDNTEAPKILVFAGSYFNNKHKFLTDSFSEFILVHNYQNILDIDYYINLFNPDIVLFESTEYTHNSTYFDATSMKEISYNKPLSSYSNLINSQFKNIDNTYKINDNYAVTDLSIPLINNETLYSYVKVGDRILDCKTITDDNNHQHIEISIPSSELSHINEITFYAISNNEMEYSEIKINL